MWSPTVQCHDRPLRAPRLKVYTVMHPESYNEGRDEENGGRDHDTPRRSQEGGVVASRGGHGGTSVVDQLKLKLSNFKF